MAEKMKENKDKLYRGLKADRAIAEKTSGHIIHEIAKGNIEVVAIKEGEKLDVEFLWILHALAWQYCNQTWIEQFMRTKELPDFTEEGMKSLQQIEKNFEKFKKNQNLTDEKIILGQNDFFNKYPPSVQLRYFPYVKIFASEIRDYLDRDNLTFTEIYNMVKKFGSVNLKGNPFIWARNPEEVDRFWERLSCQGGICEIYCYPDDEFLKPLAKDEKPVGRKKIVNGEKEDTIDFLFVFNFSSHSWGLAFLKSCLMRRVNLIDRSIYKLKRPAQVLYFATLWIDSREPKKFWLTTKEICGLLNWEYPQANMRRLRSNIQGLINYMLKEKVLKRKLPYNRADDLWFIMPAEKKGNNE